MQINCKFNKFNKFRKKLRFIKIFMREPIFLIFNYYNGNL